jgi:hypothetical protein
VPGCSVQNGLRLISLDQDVLEMVDVHKGTPIVELYLVSFNLCRANEYNDYGGDGRHPRIDRDDPYWNKE